MAKKRLLTTMFKSITCEERKAKLKCDVQIFNEQIVQKLLVVNKPEKHHVGKLRKVVATILSSQEIKKKDEEPTNDKKQ